MSNVTDSEDELYEPYERETRANQNAQYTRENTRTNHNTTFSREDTYARRTNHNAAYTRENTYAPRGHIGTLTRETTRMSYIRRNNSTYASRLRIRALSVTPIKGFELDEDDLPFRPLTITPSKMKPKDLMYDHKPFEMSKEKPDLIKFGYSSRPTASGLIDPWEDLSMDHKILPKIHDKPLVSQSPYSSRKSQKKKSITPRGQKEGSTMCPQFPIIGMPVKKWETKPLTYMDVPDMRKQLDKCYMKINNKDKTNVEYVRTKQDFYRMELDKLDEVHPSNRGRMKMTYNAYLANTHGSKQAIQECLKGGNHPTTQQQQQQQEMMQQEQEV